MCYLCLCSQRYIVVHVELVDFLRLWRQLEQRRHWLTTQQLTKFLAIQPVRVSYLILLESTTPVYLAIYGYCSQRFLCHRSYACTCLDHELKLCGRDSMHAHTQLSRVHLTSTLDVTHVIKCTRLSLTLTGRAWEWGYNLGCRGILLGLPGRRFSTGYHFVGGEGRCTNEWGDVFTAKVNFECCLVFVVSYNILIRAVWFIWVFDW